MEGITKITIVAGAIALVFGGLFVANRAVSQQSQSQPEVRQRFAVTVPFEYGPAERRQVPAAFMARLRGDRGDESPEGAVSIIDMSLAIDSKTLTSLAPSLQPRLYIGNTVYNVQRVELSNWNPRTEKPLDESEPVGQTHFYHFFLTDGDIENIDDDEIMFLTTLEKDQILDKSIRNITLDRLIEIDKSFADHSGKFEKRRIAQ